MARSFLSKALAFKKEEDRKVAAMEPEERAEYLERRQAAYDARKGGGVVGSVRRAGRRIERKGRHEIARGERNIRRERERVEKEVGRIPRNLKKLGDRVLGFGKLLALIPLLIVGLILWTIFKPRS